MTTSKQIREEIKSSFVCSVQSIYTLTPWRDAVAYVANSGGRGPFRTIHGLLVKTNDGKSVLFREP